MANEAEQAIYTRLANAPTFHPVTADLFVNDWGLDAGDVVTVRSGETDYSVPIYNMSLDWRGSAMAQIQSTGNKERKPLSALKRKQFASGRAGYRAEQKVDEQSVIYERHFEATDRHVTSVLSATGVKLDIDGNPETVYNPVTGEYEYVFDEEGGNLASRITQTAGELSAEVAARTADGVSFNSRITQTANSISQIVQAVGRNGEVTAASIALAINASGSEAVISADHIELDGDTVASILYGKQVEVDEINAATADFIVMDVEDRLSVNGNMTVIGDATFTSITLDGDSFSSVVTDFSISGNALTLYRSNGTSETFRKATSLSGSWSGMTYTVAASPAGTLEPLVTRLAMQTPTGTGVSCDVNLVEFTDPEDPTQTIGHGSRKLYLKEKEGYFYITNTEADPTDSNTLAKKVITGGGSADYDAGWAAATDANMLVWPSENTTTAGFVVKAPGSTVDTQTSKSFVLDQTGNTVYAYMGGTTVAVLPVTGGGTAGIESLGSSGATYSESVYNGWEGTALTGINYGGFYQVKAEAKNGEERYVKFAVPADNGGIASLGTHAASFDPSDYADWEGSSLGTINYGGYYQIKATPNSGSPAYVKFAVPADRYNEGRYAGKASVSLLDPTWNPKTGDIDAYRTVTVKTSGRTNASGLADEVEKSVALTLSRNGQTVYLKHGETSVAKLTVPATSHNITCSSTVASIGTNRGQRSNAGSISKSGLVAQSYLGLTMSCGGTSKQFYITVNP